jgi:nitroreductase
MANEANEVLDTILKRRTVRTFQQKEVPDEVIGKLVEAAMYAPSRLGKRPWHFVVIREPRIKEGLASALKLHPAVGLAPVVIAICGNRRVSSTWDLDGAAAAQNILIAATSLGLATAWIGGHATALWDSVSSVFEEAVCAPPDIGLLALIAVGYADEETKPRTKDELWDHTRVHWDRWDAVRA